jgi:hypothetical protein
MISGHAPTGVVTDAFGSTTQYRCLCCNGVIAGVPDEDTAIGLSSVLGLVSDECAFICNECTARLIEAAAAQKATTSRRR